MNGAQPPMMLTTEGVQQILEENQRLIEAIISNQNRGKFDDCVAYQQKLQQNLTLLASVADQHPGGRGGTPQSRVQPHPPGMRDAPPIAPQPSKRDVSHDSSHSGEKKEIRYWSDEEHQKFLEGLQLFSGNGKYDLNAISKHIGTRTPTQIRSHLQKYSMKQKSQTSQ